MNPTKVLLYLAATALLLVSQVAAQQISNYDRERGQQMLKQIKDDVKSKYYDASLHGMDVEARFAAASEKMKTASSNGQIMGIIAQVLIELGDSHTFFIPPSRVAKTEYGWKLTMIGERAFVTAVKPGSDAEAKGLKVGDEILAIDERAPTRDTLWLMKYLYYALRPQPGMKLTIRRPEGKQEEIVVLANVTDRKKVVNLVSGSDIWDLIREDQNESHLNRHRYAAVGDVFVWKMPAFDLEESKIDDMMDKAGKYGSLVLDLRGNPGGAVTTLNRLVGNFFDREVKIADWQGRKKFDPQMAKLRGKAYNGKLIVLIDSESASCSEIFARVVQLEKRGTVIGDRSAGAVMVSQYYGHKSGIDVVAFYGSNITAANLIMTDGKSLEKVGVMPDQLLLVSQTALAAGRDPLLAKAVEMAGGKLDPDAAGKMFPIEWPK